MFHLGHPTAAAALLRLRAAGAPAEDAAAEVAAATFEQEAPLPAALDAALRLLLLLLVMLPLL